MICHPKVPLYPNSVLQRSVHKRKTLDVHKSYFGHAIAVQCTIVDAVVIKKLLYTYFLNNYTYNIFQYVKKYDVLKSVLFSLGYKHIRYCIRQVIFHKSVLVCLELFFYTLNSGTSVYSI